MYREQVEYIPYNCENEVTMNILTILNPSKLLPFLFKMSLNFSVTFQKFISDYR